MQLERTHGSDLVQNILDGYGKVERKTAFLQDFKYFFILNLGFSCFKQQFMFDCSLVDCGISCEIHSIKMCWYRYNVQQFMFVLTNDVVDFVWHVSMC